MTLDPLPIHGGDIAAASARYGVPRADWLDLSTGINPNPYPAREVPEAAWRALPDAALGDALTAAARAGYGVAARASIVAASGTQALIQWLPRLVVAHDVAVVSPTYGEHAAAWAAVGAKVREVERIEDGDDADVLVVEGDALRMNPRRLDRPMLVLESEATACAAALARFAGCLLAAPAEPDKLRALASLALKSPKP